MTAKQMGRIFAPLLAILFSVGLAGCKTSGMRASSEQWDAPKVENPIFVITAIDMSDMPGYFREATLERESPEPKVTIHSFHIKRDKDFCIFFTEDLSPGRYQLEDFTIRLPDRDLTFKMHGNRKLRSDFTTPGVHYIGALKPREIRRHGRVSYKLEIVHHPTERQAIERILPDASNDFWKNMLTERLHQLRR